MKAARVKRGRCTTSSRATASIVAAACAFAACIALVGVACVDGTTPQCADPSSGCGPDFDGNFPDVVEGGDAPSNADANDAKPADGGTDGNGNGDGNASDAPPG